MSEDVAIIVRLLCLGCGHGMINNELIMGVATTFAQLRNLNFGSHSDRYI